MKLKQTKKENFTNEQEKLARKAVASLCRNYPQNSVIDGLEMFRRYCKANIDNIVLPAEDLRPNAEKIAHKIESIYYFHGVNYTKMRSMINDELKNPTPRPSLIGSTSVWDYARPTTKHKQQDTSNKDAVDQANIAASTTIIF